MSSDQANLEPEIDVRRYLDILLRRRWLTGAFVGLSLTVAFVVNLLSPPVYRGSVTLMVDRGGFNLGLVPDLFGAGQQALVETLAEVVKSRVVAEGALDRLQVPPTERETQLRRLQDGLQVRRIRGADMIRISADGSTPDQAAATANAVANAFLDWHTASRRSEAEAARGFVQGQLGTVGLELRFAEDALAAYKSRGEQVVLNEQTTLVVTKAAEFEAQRRAIAAERESIEASLKTASAELSRLAPTVPSSAITAEDPVSVDLRGELAKLEVDLASMREELTERHPRRIATEKRIEEVKNAIKRRAAQRLASQTAGLNPLYQELAGRVIQLQVQRDALRAKETALAVVVSRYNRDVKALPSKELELARLTREMKVAEATFLLLSQKLQEARIAEASIVGNLRVVDRAVPPTTPVAPGTLLNVLLGALLGLLGGIGAALIAESLDSAIRSPDDASVAANLPVLATIPFWREASAPPRNQRPLSAGDPWSVFAESFRHFRTSLLYYSPDRPLRTILVTSPGPNEGKTIVASNLAFVLAQSDRRVCLVECDLRKPGLQWVFQPRTSFGLTDLLVDGLAPDQVVHPTEFDHLWFLSSGTRPPNPAELLGSQKMREFLRHGVDGAEILVLDGPPVLPVTDSAVLAPTVDGVVLVVRLGTTPREAVSRARQRLEAVGARVLGLVVNGMPIPRHGNYYVYSSYYGRTEPSPSDTPPAPRA